MHFFHQVHQRLFLLINAEADAHPATVALAVFCAEYLLALYLVWQLADLLWRHRGHPGLWLGLLCSLLLAAAAYLIRKGYAHPRPFTLPLGTQFLPHSPSSSFPSKHMTAIAAATIWLWLQRPHSLSAYLAIAVMLLVAWSRVYLGVHWPMDMVGGLVVGGVAALWVRQMMAGFRRGSGVHPSGRF